MEIQKYLEIKQGASHKTWVQEELSRVIKYFELNVNEKIIFQNVWDIVKIVVRETFRASNAITHKCNNKKTTQL